MESFFKLSLRTLDARKSLSTNITFSAPLEIHSIPNDPTPEYRSKILEFSTLILINFECIKILKIFSLTESFNGLVFKFFK